MGAAHEELVIIKISSNKNVYENCLSLYRVKKIVKYLNIILKKAKKSRYLEKVDDFKNHRHCV